MVLGHTAIRVATFRPLILASGVDQDQTTEVGFHSSKGYQEGGIDTCTPLCTESGVCDQETPLGSHSLAVVGVTLFVVLVFNRCNGFS